MRFVTRIGVFGRFTALRQLTGSAVALSATISQKVSDRSVELDRYTAGLLLFFFFFFLHVAIPICKSVKVLSVCQMSNVITLLDF